MYEEDVRFLVRVALVVIAFIAVYVFAANFECKAKTGDMGVAARWSVLGGCQVQVEEGWWIPLENFRYVSE